MDVIAVVCAFGLLGLAVVLVLVLVLKPSWTNDQPRPGVTMDDRPIVPVAVAPTEPAMPPSAPKCWCMAFAGRAFPCYCVSFEDGA